MKKKAVLYFGIFTMTICLIYGIIHYRNQIKSRNYKIAIKNEREQYADSTYKIFQDVAHMKSYDEIYSYFKREPDKISNKNGQQIMVWFLDGHYEIDVYLNKENNVENMAYRQYFYNVVNLLEY